MAKQNAQVKEPTIYEMEQQSKEPGKIINSLKQKILHKSSTKKTIKRSVDSHKFQSI